MKLVLAAVLMSALLAAAACQQRTPEEQAPLTGCRFRGQSVPCAAFEEHTGAEMMVRFAEEECTSIALSALSEAEVWNYSQANAMASFDERHHANVAIASAIKRRGCACHFAWRRYVARYPQDLPFPECRPMHEVRAGQVVQ